MASLGKVIRCSFFTNTSLRVLGRYPLCSTKRHLSRTKIFDNLNLQTFKVPTVSKINDYHSNIIYLLDGEVEVNLCAIKGVLF